MRKSTLKKINEVLENSEINYEFGEWNSEIVYPYFVGEYQESPEMNEDGMQETSFILNGFHRGSIIDLQEAKEVIEKQFDSVSGGIAGIDEDGMGYAILYENSMFIPLENSDLKRIQINLSIKEWKVN